MSLLLESSPLIYRLAFGKEATSRIERFKTFPFNSSMQMLDDRAVKLPKQLIGRSPLVNWQGKIQELGVFFKKRILLLQEVDVAAVRQVEASSQVYYRADHRRLVEASPTFLLLRPPQSALVVLLSKIDATAQPVVIVLTGLQLAPAFNHIVENSFIAPVESYHKIRQLRVHSLPIKGGETIFFIDDASRTKPASSFSNSIFPYSRII